MLDRSYQFSRYEITPRLPVCPPPGWLFIGSAAEPPAGTGASAASFSPFGIGADHQTSQHPEKWIPQMAKIGIPWCGRANANWDYVEPQEGKWDWTKFDQQMSCMASHGIQPGCLLMGNPSWNTKDRPGTLPVNNLHAWSAYVSEMVRHCRGKVKYYEIWNEPPNGTGREQTPADYAKLVVAADEAAKAVDPDCLIGLAASRSILITCS